MNILSKDILPLKTSQKFSSVLEPYAGKVASTVLRRECHCEVMFLSDNKFYTYGEYYYGVYVTVAVMGYPQNVPTVKLNSTIGILVSTNNIASPSGSILNGKEYRFFIRKIPVAQAVYISDIDVSGSLEVYDGATLKDVTTIK